MLCCISEPEINCNSWWAFIITFWMRMSGLLSLTPSSQHAVLHLCWDCSEDLSEMRVALRSLEVSLKGEMGQIQPKGNIQPAAPQGAGVLQRRFAGKWMNVFKAVPGIHFIARESMFCGDSELSRRPDWALQSRSWSKNLHVYVLCLEGISP